MHGITRQARVNTNEPGSRASSVEQGSESARADGVPVEETVFSSELRQNVSPQLIFAYANANKGLDVPQ